MEDITESFEKLGVVPVVVLEDAKDAVPLATALVDGGLPCAEVTFRTEAGRREYSSDDGTVSENAGWSGNCAYC